MKMSYIANARIPTEKAHGIQIMKMCEAFVHANVDLELVLPKRKNAIKGDPFSYISLKSVFPIRFLSVLDWVSFGFAGFQIETISFALGVLWYVKDRMDRLLYSRDEMVLFFISYLKNTFVWEAHEGKWNMVVKRVAKRSKKIICISLGVKHALVGHGVPEEKLIVSPDGVDIEAFFPTIGMDEARKRLGLPREKPIVLYSGHLYAWKGAQVLADAAKLTPEALFVFVGGTEKDLMHFRKKYGAFANIRIEGLKKHEMIPLYLRAADIVSLPNLGTEAISKLYTSPLKMFEYMASGKAIIASDLPSLREILDEDSAFFVTAGDSLALARGIQKLLSDAPFMQKIAKAAHTKSLRFDWSIRAKEIITAIE